MKGKNKEDIIISMYIPLLEKRIIDNIRVNNQKRKIWGEGIVDCDDANTKTNKKRSPN